MVGADGASFFQRRAGSAVQGLFRCSGAEGILSEMHRPAGLPVRWHFAKALIAAFVFENPRFINSSFRIAVYRMGAGTENGTLCKRFPGSNGFAACQSAAGFKMGKEDDEARKSHLIVYPLIVFARERIWFYKKGGISMEAPGPISICITNMVIVFGVLIFLACVIQLIHIVDPTKKK